MCLKSLLLYIKSKQNLQHRFYKLEVFLRSTHDKYLKSVFIKVIQNTRKSLLKIKSSKTQCKKQLTITLKDSRQNKKIN